MTDSKIPSSRPAAPATGGTGGKTGGPQGAVTPVNTRTPVQDAPVQQSPAGFLLSGQTTELEGTVLSSNPASGQIKLSTPRGDFIVNSDKNIPAGTPVILRLTMQRNRLLASLTLLQRKETAETKAQEAKAQDPIAPTPAKEEAAPALKAGDTVAAVRLSSETAEDGAPLSPAPRRLTLQDVAQSLQSLSPAQLRQLPGPPPLPPDVMYRLAQAQNIQQALAQLTPAQQQAVLDYAARADVQAVLDTFSPQAVLQNALNAAAGATTDAATADADIVRIIRTLQPPPAADAPQKPVSALTSLLPLLQTLEQSAAQTGEAFLNTPQSGFPAETSAAGLLPKNLSSLTILGISTPDAKGNAPTPGLPPAITTGNGEEIILGVVDAVTPSGYPVIHTEAGQDFVLKTQAHVAVGSKILFTIGPMSARDALHSFGQADPLQDMPFNPLLAVRWPALRDALQTVNGLAPDIARQAANAIPTTAAARFAPTTLLFLAALRLDSVQSWLGENMLQVLRQNGKQDLIDRLTGDFSKNAEQSRTALPSGWRIISLPLLHEGEISQAQFFWRRQQGEDDQDGAAGKKPMTRFIVNLHLSRLGDMQLDGLMRQKRLDMILRAGRMLPPSVRQDLMQAYGRALTQTGMQGSLGFQVRADKWVDIDLPHQSGVSA